MKHIAPGDVIAASREIPQVHAALMTHLEKNIRRLTAVNPAIGGLIGLIGQNAENAHERVLTYTPEEFRNYVMSMILLTIRTIEIAESREEEDELSQPVVDPNVLMQEFIAKIGKPK